MLTVRSPSAEGMHVIRLTSLVVLLPLCLVGADRPGLAQVIGLPGMGMPGGRNVPGQAYDLAQVALASGNLTEALELAKAEYKGAIKFGTRRWIDSAAAAAMVGECQFELGRFRAAVTSYDESILQAVSLGDWLLDIRFQDLPLRPLNRQPRQLWAASPRPMLPADLPDRMSIRLGTADARGVMQGGGVLAAPVDYPLRPHEIMRSLAISLYRRAELLGPLAKNGRSLEAAVAWLQRRPAPPNHFSQAWIDVCLGIAYWSQGRTDQAQPLLNRGLLLEGQLDHPLTPWGLLVGGRIELAAGRYKEAAALCEAAAFAAAVQSDARCLEEAFRWAVAGQLAAGGSLPPTVAAAAAWADDGLPSLAVRLRLLLAVATAETGDRGAAARILSDIDRRQLQGDLGQGWCGATAAYASALIDYAGGNRPAGDSDLSQALALARSRSPRLFQTQALTEAVAASQSGLADREIDQLFAKLLGDPEPGLVRTDPLEALAVMSTERTAAFEAWLWAARNLWVTNSRGDEAWLDAAEASSRSRWLSSRDLGGRRDAVLRLLAFPPAAGDSQDQRRELLARQADLAVTLAEVDQLVGPLRRTLEGAAGPPDPAAEPQLPGDPDQWKRYATASAQLRGWIDRVAAGRDLVPLDFPPLLPTTEIRDRLTSRQRLLSFAWTEAGLYGCLEATKQAAVWQVKQPVAVRKAMAALAKSLCLYHPLKPVLSDRLASAAWQDQLAELAELLFEGSGISLARHEEFDELVVVPDGLLWYLPFELLPVGPAEEDHPDVTGTLRLHDVCQLRYCPTRSLAVSRRRFPPAEPLVAVYQGAAFRGDSPERAAAALTRFTSGVRGSVCLSPTAAKTPAALAASLADTVAVFDDLTARPGENSRPLVAAVAGRPGLSLADWLVPPPKAARCVVLTGLQTQFSAVPAKEPGRAGADLFQAAMDLAAAGAETMVLSRWNVGGQVALDLGISFLQDRQGSEDHGPPPPAAVSWRRAVRLVTAERPDFQREPRLQLTRDQIPADATHPFFWAGYTLIDCGLLPEAPLQPAPPAEQPVNKPAGS